MALVAADEPVKFFGVIPFYLVSYTSTVIPVIFVIIVQSFVEKWLNKVIPKAVNLVFVPMFTFLIMGTLALSVCVQENPKQGSLACLPALRR